MTDKRKTQLKEAQQTYRDKQKKRKPIVEKLIANIKQLLVELDKS